MRLDFTSGLSSVLFVTLWRWRSYKKYSRIQFVPQSKQHFTITKISSLTLFKEIIAVYSDNHTKHKRRIKSYRLLKHVVPTVTIRLWTVRRVKTKEIRTSETMPLYGNWFQNSSQCGTWPSYVIKWGVLRLCIKFRITHPVWEIT
jgi:hypothetical protein